MVKKSTFVHFGKIFDFLSNLGFFEVHLWGFKIVGNRQSDKLKKNIRIKFKCVFKYLFMSQTGFYRAKWWIQIKLKFRNFLMKTGYDPPLTVRKSASTPSVLRPCPSQQYAGRQTALLLGPFRPPSSALLPPPSFLRPPSSAPQLCYRTEGGGGSYPGHEKIPYVGYHMVL